MTVSAPATALTLNGGILGMKIAHPTGSDHLQVAALALGAADTTLNLAFGNAPPGVYTLVTAGSPIENPENITHLNIPRIPPETATEISISEDGKSVILTVASLKSLAWQQSTGIWSVTAPDLWSDLNNPERPRTYSDDYSVNFNTLGSGEATVSVAGTVSPLFMAFNNPSTAYTFTDGGSGSIVIPAAIGLETAAGGQPVAINVPLTLSKSLFVSENSALTLGAAFGGGFTPAAAVYNASLTLQPGSTLTFASGIEQTIDAAFSGSGTIVKTGGGTLILNKAPAAFSGQIQANGGLIKLNAASFFQNPAYLAQDAYPLLIGDNASVFLYAGAIQATAGMAGSNFARLATGATLQHEGYNHNQQSRIRVDGNAKIINGSGYAWVAYPAAVFEVTAGTAEFSENAVNTSGAAFTLAGGNSASDRVTFDVAPGAGFTFTGSIHIYGNTTLTGIRKRGGGAMTIEKESTRALTVANNYATGVFSFDLPFDVEAGRLTLNRTNITGTGTYTAFSGAVIGGSGVIGEGGTLAAQPGGVIETGLTAANLTLEAGATIAVTAEPATLATTGALTLPDPTLINADAVSLGAYGKFCDVLTWVGEAPAAGFALTGAKRSHFYLVKTASSLQLWRRTGILISLH